MAKKNVKVNTQATETEVVEVIEAPKEQAVTETIPEGPKFTLLFTASRGNNRRFSWYQIEVKPEDATTKVKGCAALLPTPVVEALGQDKFVSWMDQSIIEACVQEGKVIRGMASTVSDVYARYTKVTDTKGERVAVALAVFKEVLEAIKDGKTTGAWERPEPEVKEEAPKAETPAA